MDFEQVIGSGKPYSVSEVIKQCRHVVMEELKNEELLTLKLTNYELYEDRMARQYPNFADRFPWLFDKILRDPYNMPYLEFMLKTLEKTNDNNIEKKTQEVVNYLSEKQK